MKIFCLIFALAVSVVLPTTIGLFACVKSKKAKPLLLGVCCFSIFQIFTRMPIVLYILPEFPKYQIFQVTKPIAYICFLSITAALFEEMGRYALMSRFMKTGSFEDGICFGIGHGGTEAVLLLGVNTVLLIAFGNAQSVSESMLFLASVERVFTQILHIGWSVLVLLGCNRTKKFKSVFTAVFTHFIVDFTAVYLSNFVDDGVYFAEGFLAFSAILMIVYIIIEKQKSLLLITENKEK